ncbi:MAG TPA: hypothetical protein VFX17_00750 [Patescibacteria group bacterium]|nr:hypothetical protein [Patescibacteria group bacterium]
MTVALYLDELRYYFLGEDFRPSCSEIASRRTIVLAIFPQSITVRGVVSMAEKKVA